MKNNVGKLFKYLILIFGLVLLVIYSCKTGSIDLSFTQIAKGLFVEFDPDVAAVYDLRFPRIIIAIIAGASLSVSGVLLQAVMQNPLTDPGIIGISAAASLASKIVILITPTLFFIAPIFSIMGGILAYLILYSLAWDRGTNPIRLILVGVALSMTFSGISQAISAISGGNLNTVQAIVEGNVAQKTWQDVKIMEIYGGIGLVASMFLGRSCDLLCLEDKTAKAIGVNVNRDRFIISIIAVALASVATAIVGVIGFLGLLVAHIARIVVGSNHRYLIPFSALLGGFILLGADTLGRIIVYPYEISPSIIMTTICGPFFIVLLKVRGKKYGN
ncbi:FecCD family ABC transporter permease [Peptoniphilus indolicus]|uniref:Probable heme-iron transport system permease protein IsdF n=2 Tax=Peptoniphilus indolicus TaxID=33030 RepID=G4D511_9FIRM|nr:iron ABC transporter permease [Peptoniphilus indolicus]EGY79386.1 ferrichrome ABC superfamily ATP binding cassette transporter, permease protein [Peptoniphilus indolicus ATCC 29427]SUB76354.1 Iron(III) dicitrate transport system permease protein fecD [Peptoniphilus indolicus]